MLSFSALRSLISETITFLEPKRIYSALGKALFWRRAFKVTSGPIPPG
jgi:hypothetical protein